MVCSAFWCHQILRNVQCTYIIIIICAAISLFSWPLISPNSSEWTYCFPLTVEELCQGILLVMYDVGHLFIFECSLFDLICLDNNSMKHNQGSDVSCLVYARYSTHPPTHPPPMCSVAVLFSGGGGATYHGFGCLDYGHACLPMAIGVVCSPAASCC